MCFSSRNLESRDSKRLAISLLKYTCNLVFRSSSREIRTSAKFGSRFRDYYVSNGVDGGDVSVDGSASSSFFVQFLFTYNYKPCTLQFSVYSGDMNTCSMYYYYSVGNNLVIKVVRRSDGEMFPF